MYYYFGNPQHDVATARRARVIISDEAKVSPMADLSVLDWRYYDDPLYTAMKLVLVRIISGNDENNRI